MSDYIRRYQENTALLSVLKIIVDISIIVIAAYVIVSFTCLRTNISGNSMQPILNNDDTVMINSFSYSLSNPHRFDIIAFKTNENSNKVFVKRVIGIPGDRVIILNGKVYINDEQLVDDVFTDNILTAGLAGNEIILQDNEYFVLGDNRNNSEDSRFANIGIVKKSNILGKVWIITRPIKRFGFVN